MAGGQGIKIWSVTEPYLDLHCGLGEGPYYEADTHRLRFVDIVKEQLHTVDLSTGPSSLHSLPLDRSVGVTADIEGVDPRKSIVVGEKRGLCLLERETGKATLLKAFGAVDKAAVDADFDEKRLRSNDGAVDPQGRFWLGTMNDFFVGEPQAEGVLFRFGSDISCNVAKKSLTIPNGLGWSTDAKTMYFTHSTESRIYAYDYDASTGDISNERVFWQHDGDGDPDGFIMDMEGHFWQAIYGEGCVLRINPEGKVVGKIELPTKCITCPAFVGTELFITSAAGDEGERYGGAVFKVDVGVVGKPKFKFKLDKKWLRV